MKDPEQLTPGDDVEATLVTPRFDDEETVLARPVVPLAAVDADALEADPAQTYAPGPPAPSYAPRWRAPRRSWMLVLVLVSAFAGSVIGGASLYFYQKGRQAQATDADGAQIQTGAPADEALQPLPEPSPEAQAETAALPTQPAAATDEGEEAEDDVPPPSESKEKEDDDEARKPEPEKKSPPRRSNDDAPPAAPKRGKKGDGETRPRRAEQYEDEGGARRVDSIVYRSRAEEREARRAERRARRRQQRQQSRSVDRVRGIFEGQPE